MSPSSGEPLHRGHGSFDGQAAIELRTYYAGTTVIEATSTGLTSASVTITFHGARCWSEIVG